MSVSAALVSESLFKAAICSFLLGTGTARDGPGESKAHHHNKPFETIRYLELQKQHAQTDKPKKRSTKDPLSKADKARNRAISRARVACENVIARLKRFKIIADRTRNRRSFGVRFFLIAALSNTELSHAERLRKRAIDWASASAVASRVPRGIVRR